ncbi:IS3 family transposase [Saccharopolyspora sp. NPDC000995]
MSKPTKRSFSFEFKLDAVRRFLGGEAAAELAAELGLSSPTLLKTWARTYRRDEEDGLRPKPKGRPPRASDSTPGQVGELERLRRENARLQAEVAYLGKLRALQEELKEAIITTFEANRRRGRRVVHRELRKAGWRVAKKTVLKLMRELDLICLIRRRRRYVSYQGTVGKIAAPGSRDLLSGRKRVLAAAGGEGLPGRRVARRRC